MRALAGLLLALSLAPAAWAGGLGGIPLPIAGQTQTRAMAVLGAQDGMAVSFIDCSLAINASATPANNYRGPLRNRLTGTGWVNCTSQGARFRSGNYFTVLTSTLPFSATVGTMAFGGSNSNPTAAVTYSAAFTDNTSNNAIGLRTNVTTGIGQFVAVAGGATQAAIGLAAVNGFQIFGQAGTWAANDFRAYQDGAAGAADTSGSIPTVDRLTIGALRTTVNPWPGFIEGMIWLPATSANGTLQSLSNQRY